MCKISKDGFVQGRLRGQFVFRMKAMYQNRASQSLWKFVNTAGSDPGWERGTGCCGSKMLLFITKCSKTGLFPLTLLKLPIFNGCR